MPKAAAKDQLESTHLKMLKWFLGVHEKASNNFCYSNTGRLPWTLTVLPQSSTTTSGIFVYEWQRQHTSPSHIPRAEAAQTKLVQRLVINSQLMHDCQTKLTSCPSINLTSPKHVHKPLDIRVAQSTYDVILNRTIDNLEKDLSQHPIQNPQNGHR